MQEMLLPPAAGRFDSSSIAAMNATIACSQYLPAAGGRLIQVIVHDSPVLDETGRLIGRIAMIESVGERKHHDEERVDKIKAQRDTLVREVHHRIKNHLQGVAGLLRQQMGEHPSLKPLLDTAVSQVLSIATVHGLQGEQQGANVAIPSLIQRIASTVSSLTLTRITTPFDPDTLQNITLMEDEAVPVALIVNELLFNAVKHAASHPTRTTSITAHLEKTALVMTVSNLGRLDARLDFAAGRGLGTGLSLVQSLMPPRGARLDFRQSGECVESELWLEPPVIQIMAG